MAGERAVKARRFSTIGEVKREYLPSMVRSEDEDTEQTMADTREATVQTVRKHLQGLSFSPK